MKDLRKIDILYLMSLAAIVTGVIVAEHYDHRTIMAYQHDLSVMYNSLTNLRNNIKFMAEEFFDYDLDEDRKERLMS